jgi:hypothetical protein
MRGLGKMVKRYISYHLREGWRVGCSLFFLAAQVFFFFYLTIVYSSLFSPSVLLAGNPLIYNEF